MPYQYYDFSASYLYNKGIQDTVYGQLDVIPLNFGAQT